MADAIVSGREIELEIAGYGSEGEGVGKRDGAVFFVPGAADGERIRARVTGAGRSPYRAALLTVLTPSVERREPPCRHYYDCGGCQLQHLSYPEQLRFKERRVRDALERIGGIPGTVVTAVRGMEDPWRYRNKVVFAAAETEPVPRPGFYAGASRRVIPVEDCLLADPAAAAIARRALELVHELPSPPGPVSQVMVRTTATGERLAVIFTRDGRLPRGEAVADELMGGKPGLQGVYAARAAYGDRPATGFNLLRGRPAVTEKLGAIVFSIGPDSFFQVNSRQAGALYDLAARSLLPASGGRVVDAYCGVGGFALFAADRAASVTGIERERAMVERANETARRNGIARVRFIAGDLERPGETAGAELAAASTLIVDPPRRGLEERFIAACGRTPLRRVLYASCDPGTLARDCRRFAGRGFSVREIIPFDMFPQTSQVECLAVLDRA